MVFLEDLEWLCHVCGELRPDDKISVAKRPLKQLPDLFPAVCFNVRYCNDRIACVREARASGPWLGRQHTEET